MLQMKKLVILAQIQREASLYQTLITQMTMMMLKMIVVITAQVTATMTTWKTCCSNFPTCPTFECRFIKIYTVCAVVKLTRAAACFLAIDSFHVKTPMKISRRSMLCVVVADCVLPKHHVSIKCCGSA